MEVDRNSGAFPGLLPENRKKVNTDMAAGNIIVRFIEVFYHNVCTFARTGRVVDMWTDTCIFSPGMLNNSLKLLREALCPSRLRGR